MSEKRIWIELIGKWGEYKSGDIAEFGMRKAKALIEKGLAKKSKSPEKKKSKAAKVNQTTVIETAAAPPVAEAAVIDTAKPSTMNVTGTRDSKKK